jgi:hypothetical protein
MRAREFVTEEKGKITKRQQWGTVGLHLFGDASRVSSTYTLNRLMMAAAATDGTFEPDMDEESWAGKMKTAHPYTKQEADILKMAYRAAGATFKDINRGDMESQEPPGGNITSVVKPFQGYPR